MREGWSNDNYWSLSEDQAESERLTDIYGLADYLPDYIIVGLKGWDDFILCDHASQYFLVPTVPLVRTYIEPFRFPAEPMRLELDERFTNKIKWYVQPIVFGGDPTDESNMLWVSQEWHAQVVKGWNKRYLENLAKQSKA